MTATAVDDRRERDAARPRLEPLERLEALCDPGSVRVLQAEGYLPKNFTGYKLESHITGPGQKPKTTTQFQGLSQGVTAYAAALAEARANFLANARAIWGIKATHALTSDEVRFWSYLQLQQGNSAGAIDSFRKEASHWPESKVFMDHMIEAASGSPHKAPVSAQKG